MKKRLILLALVLVCAMVLSACGCKHETWLDADCVTPKTCAECGETEGAALGHSWLAATCDTAKTCEVCGETEGEALGHSWADATCTAPKTCTACSLTEGEALGHTWVDATTEAPKTCSACGETEGERIITDERFTTASTADIQGTWEWIVNVNGEMIGEPDFPGEIGMKMTMILGNDGSMAMTVELADEDAFKADMAEYMIDMLYTELAAAGLDQAAADAAMLQAYGMNVADYVAFALDSMDFNELMTDANREGVYYVADSTLYIGDSWTDTMTPTPFSFDGDKLTMEEDLTEMGLGNPVFTRVTE